MSSRAGLLFVAIAAVDCGRPSTQPAPHPEVTLQPFYSAEAIAADVVDGETKKAVSSAVVVAVWRRIELFSERWDGIYRLSEVTTDARGHFTIDAWGPRPNDPTGYLDRRGPELWIMKAGYAVEFANNTRQVRVGSRPPASGETVEFVTLPPSKTRSPRRTYELRGISTSVWRGRKLMLHRVTPRDLADSLANANPCDPYFPPTSCSIPRYLEEWQRSRNTLPPSLRTSVPFPPRSIIDYEAPADRSARQLAPR